MCQPPGKKLATLSLLSGGEQTLTALALIFAVFLANPAPICVLDEVDAPLDDANVGRFCDMLDEMCRRTETRFLIITHHAVTMSRMDRLFGVTMAEQGVSQLGVGRSQEGRGDGRLIALNFSYRLTFPSAPGADVQSAVNLRSGRRWSTERKELPKMDVLRLQQERC